MLPSVTGFSWTTDNNFITQKYFHLSIIFFSGSQYHEGGALQLDLHLEGAAPVTLLVRDMVANQGTAASHVTCLLICYWSGEGRVPVHQVAPPGVRRLLAAPLSQGAGQEGGGQAGHTQPVQYLYTFYRASTNFLYTIYIFYKLTTQYLHSIHVHEVTASLTLYIYRSAGAPPPPSPTMTLPLR